MGVRAPYEVGELTVIKFLKSLSANLSYLDKSQVKVRGLREPVVTPAATPTAAGGGCPGPCRSLVTASATFNNNGDNKIIVYIANNYHISYIK